MPIKEASKKDLRKSKKRAARNKKVTIAAKVLIKKARKAIVAQEKETALELINKTIKTVDKAAQKGIIKKNTAARAKSRLMKRYNKLVAEKK